MFQLTLKHDESSRRAVRDNFLCLAGDRLARKWLRDFSPEGWSISGPWFCQMQRRNGRIQHDDRTKPQSFTYYALKQAEKDSILQSLAVLSFWWESSLLLRREFSHLSGHGGEARRDLRVGSLLRSAKSGRTVKEGRWNEHSPYEYKPRKRVIRRVLKGKERRIKICKFRYSRVLKAFAI